MYIRSHTGTQSHKTYENHSSDFKSFPLVSMPNTVVTEGHDIKPHTDGQGIETPYTFTVVTSDLLTKL